MYFVIVNWYSFGDRRRRLCCGFISGLYLDCRQHARSFLHIYQQFKNDQRQRKCQSNITYHVSYNLCIILRYVDVHQSHKSKPKQKLQWHITVFLNHSMTRIHCYPSNALTFSSFFRLALYLQRNIATYLTMTSLKWEHFLEYLAHNCCIPCHTYRNPASPVCSNFKWILLITFISFIQCLLIIFISFIQRLLTSWCVSPKHSLSVRA